MDNFLKYLSDAQRSFKNNSFENIHIVIGNESCDLDSCICSLALGYLLYKQKIPEIPSGALILPVQNVTYEHFLLRTDNCFVLREKMIPLDLLVYRDQIDFEKLVKNKHVTTSIVDHHVLSKNEEILYDTVKQIFDHRPVDPSCKWAERNITVRIEEVGSCSTLIADEIMKINKDILFKELACVIYETMIYDTIALLPENGKAKDLDLTVASKLETQFNFKDDRKITYDKLWKAHNDVSHLSPSQMLLKDLKIVDKIPIPGLPMLLEDFIKMDNAYSAIKKFAEDYNSSLLVLIGLDARCEVKRDVAIFFESSSIHLKDVILNKFKNSQQLKGYDFSFKEVPNQFDDIICLRQQNIKLSRKQIIPLVKDALSEI